LDLLLTHIPLIGSNKEEIIKEAITKADEIFVLDIVLTEIARKYLRERESEG